MAGWQGRRLSPAVPDQLQPLGAQAAWERSCWIHFIPFPEAENQGGAFSGLPPHDGSLLSVPTQTFRAEPAGRGQNLQDSGNNQTHTSTGLSVTQGGGTCPAKQSLSRREGLSPSMTQAQGIPHVNTVCSPKCASAPQHTLTLTSQKDQTNFNIPGGWPPLLHRDSGSSPAPRHSLQNFHQAG